MAPLVELFDGLPRVALGVGPDRWSRWEREGLRDDEADAVAVRLRLHPSMIWGDEWRLAGLRADERAAVERGTWSGWAA